MSLLTDWPYIALVGCKTTIQQKSTDSLLLLQDLGTPSEKIWPGVSELQGMKKCTFTEYSYNTLRNKFGQYLSDVGFDLLNR